MFISHAPAGYLLALLFRKVRHSKLGIAFAIFASLSPDLDLLFFYLIDNRAHLHHSYWSHIPFYWVSIYTLFLAISAGLNSKKLFRYATLYFLCVMLHLSLDTISGGILWAYPFSDKYITFVIVRPIYKLWVLNFIFHWTFCLEILIFSVSIYIACSINKQKALLNKRPSFSRSLG